MNIREKRIPVPWGHLAVRLHGDEKNSPVLMFHGILDNVGTFDRLIPLLPSNFYYICVDLPGHGQSSHLPATTVIHTIDNILVFKILVDYFGRKEYIIIGHSYCAQISILFAQVYPEHVLKLVMLDAIYLHPIATKQLKTSIRNQHKNYLKLLRNSKKNPPEYTREEALEKLITKRLHGDLTREAAEPLLNQGIIPLENGKIKFSFDQRYKNILNPTFDFAYIADFLKKAPVKCPVLILLTSEMHSKHLYFKSTWDQLGAQENVKIINVQGSHDVHNVNPGAVAPHINKFLQMKSKL